MRYDLHMHTVHSDGEKTPQEVLALAKEARLAGVSITDHDTISAYPEALNIAQELSLEIVPGIEISCLHDQKPVHVLAYAFDIHNSSFKAFLKGCQQMRLERNLGMIERFKKLNIIISPEELEVRFKKQMTSIGRPHFAQWLIEHEYAKSFSDAFNRYLGDNKKCFVLGHRPSVVEALDAVGTANAFSVLAHPHLISDASLAKELMELHFDGLEGYYARLPPSREQKWVAKAQEKGWIVTGGSDYHGEAKPINALGSSWVDENTFKILQARYDQNRSLSTDSPEAQLP